MSWRRRNTVTQFCHDVTCEGATGFPVVVVPATETDPAWLAEDACPLCKGDLHDAPIAWENPVDALADELEQAGVLEENEQQEVDWRHVFKAVHAELERQRAVRYRAEREAERAAREATPEATAALDAEFPPVPMFTEGRA